MRLQHAGIYIPNQKTYNMYLAIQAARSDPEKYKRIKEVLNKSRPVTAKGQ